VFKEKLRYSFFEYFAPVRCTQLPLAF